VNWLTQRKFLAVCLGTVLVSVGVGAQKTMQTNSAGSPTTRRTATANNAVTDTAPIKWLGSKSAPITMEFFSDFECPACRAMFLETLPHLIENYVNTGKLYFVDRYFPLQGHKYSRLATRYADAAARIGKFEPAARALFNRQETWASTANGNGDVDGVVASVLTPAEMAKVRELVRNEPGKLDADIDKDVQLGSGIEYRVMQTPTTLITYKGQTTPIIGYVSYPILKQYLDELLKR